jgi:hypothetical protein
MRKGDIRGEEQTAKALAADAHLQEQSPLTKVITEAANKEGRKSAISADQT